MSPQTIAQEMLLFTNTSFAQRELFEWDDAARNETKNSAADQLEKACWSGLLFEMFPEMFERSDRKTMCVWRVNQAEQFVHIELSSSSVSPENMTTIDPYFFCT